MTEKQKLVIFALGGNEISPIEIDPVTGNLIPPDYQHSGNVPLKRARLSQIL